MKLTNIIRLMEQAGAKPEAIISAIKAIEEENAIKREKWRQNKRRHRGIVLNNNNHVSKTIEDKVSPLSSPLNSPLSLSPTPPITNPPYIPPTITPSNSSDDDITRVREVFENVEKIINSPMPLFSSPVSAWLSWGADYDLDIKPVAERWKKKNPIKAMNSLEWLNDDIAKSIIQRRRGMPEVSIPPPRNSETEAKQLAETLEFIAELNGATKQ